MGAVTFAEHRPHEALFIPTGFIVLEKASTPALVYGLRRPLLIQDKVHAEAYACMMDLYRAANMSLGKMEVALQIMKVPVTTCLKS